MSIKDKLAAIDILKGYKGNNPYILMSQRDVIFKNNDISDFCCEYVLKNHNKTPILINKTIKIADWYQVKKKEDWNLEFMPEKIAIKWLLGETATTYHCYAKYRQSVDAVQVFIPKKAVLTNFLVPDYRGIKVDFDRYDTLSMSKDINRKLRNHQKEGVQFLLARKKCVLADDMGYGKLEPVSSLIPTPSGFKRMGDIKKGDMVFDMHGIPVEVLEIYPHYNKDIYEVCFSDGSKVKCGLEHLWYVQNVNWTEGNWKTMSLEDIMKHGVINYDSTQAFENTAKFQWFIPTVQPVKYPHKDLFIHPYVLGSTLLCNAFKLTDGKGNIFLNSYYKQEIERLGLNVEQHCKFIPEEYKLSSIEQRKELLMGLLDSNGSINPDNNTITYSTISKDMAADVCEIVNSLGGIAMITEHQHIKNNVIENTYQVQIHVSFCPFKFHSKQQRYNPNIEVEKRYITSITLVGKEDAQCIYVNSPEHTYVTGKNYVVTHNTTTLSVAAIEGNFDSVLIICPASIKTTWKKELMWYVPERDITIVEGIQGKTKSDLEKYLGYKEGKSGKKVAELQEEAKERGKWVDNRFVIVNFDILDEIYKIPTTRSKENIDKAYQESPMLQYLMNRKSLIIIDEAHRLSNSTSIRYKIIRDMIKRAQPDSIYAATGTPITNNPMSFYCVLQFLGDSITSDYNYYMERYCNAHKFPKNAEEKEKRNRISTNYINSKNKVNWYQLTDDEKTELNQIIDRNVKMITVPDGASNLEELKERVSHIYLRRVKEDLNDLPNKNIHEVHYDLSSIQQQEYNRLWEEYELSYYEQNPDKELNKDLLEGAIYRKYCSLQMIPHTIKLAESLISQGRKVIIATCYDDEINQLKDYFGERAVMYNGKMNAKQKDAAQKSFTEDENVVCFLGNIAAASVGLTLIVSNALIFNSFSYTDADNKQMQDRIYRIGQTKDVDIYYQMFRQTRCEDVWNICLRKENIANTVIKKESEK